MGEQDAPGQDQLHQMMFFQLVMMFRGMAMQGMGKVMDPATQKVERNLEQARYAIDTLGMLEARTKGNLGEDEKRLLEHALFELRMNFVDENKRGPDTESEEDPATVGDGEAESTESGEPGGAAAEPAPSTEGETTEGKTTESEEPADSAS